MAAAVAGGEAGGAERAAGRSPGEHRQVAAAEALHLVATSGPAAAAAIAKCDGFALSLLAPLRPCPRSGAPLRAAKRHSGGVRSISAPLTLNVSIT